jgi:sigma-B regulation protein RsbU (phosphoserine phosphatase)
MLQRASGFPLGFDEFSNYLEHIVLFSPGDRLILYSDGVNECSNGSDAFGFQRLENCLMTASDMHPQQLARRVIDSLLEFNENKKLEDDVTLLIAKFEENTVNSS